MIEADKRYKAAGHCTYSKECQHCEARRYKYNLRRRLIDRELKKFRESWFKKASFDGQGISIARADTQLDPVRSMIVESLYGARSTGGRSSQITALQGLIRLCSTSPADDQTPTKKRHID